MNHWTHEQKTWLAKNYPERGLKFCAEWLSRSPASIRAKSSKMGLKQCDGEFRRDWQRRAAESKVGKKRPAQALVMRELHSRGALRQTTDQRKATGRKVAEHQKVFGHPRGALGMRHTQRAKDAIAQGVKAQWDGLTAADVSARTRKALHTRATSGRIREQPVGRSWKAGWREIDGQRAYFRSRWEANYARYLGWMRGRGEIISWEHEPETFWFEGIRRGCVSYLPDFRITFPLGAVEYHEVKGWMDAASKTKIKRMARYHPKVKLVVIDSKSYASLNKSMGRVIQGWES